MDDRPPPTRPSDGPDRRGGPRVSRRSLLVLGAAGLASIPVLGSGARGGVPLAAASDRRDRDALDLRDFGAAGDGRTDDTRALQRLLDTSARRRALAVVPAGTYRCTSGLLLRSDVALHLDRRARLVKDWAAPPGMVDAFFRNADFTVKSDRVRISGTGTIGAVDHSRTGVVLALYGDDVSIRDITIDTYSGGQAVMFSGDRGRMHRVTIRGSADETGTGGIRVIGGEGFLGTECHVESGDDCLQFVPIGNPEAEPTLYNQSISGGSFVGCTGASSVSRFMVALLEFTRDDPGTTDMDASVVDCSFRDCHGSAANRGIVVKNTHSSGAIERVTFTDCTVDMSRAADASTQEIRVQTDPASQGAIRDVTFTRTEVTSPVNSPLRVGGPNISGLAFEECTFTAPSGAAPTTVVVDGTDRPQFRDCTFVGAPGKRMLVAGPVTPVTALSVENCRFTGIPDGMWGVDVLGAAGARIAGSTFQQAAGATTARAIRVSPQASGVVIEGNDVTGISNPQPVTDRATGTVLTGNRGL
jgi:Pectate lyase superfamily protein